MRKCFGIGLNKTGTKTLGSALSALGYRTVSFRPDLMEKFSRGETEPAISVADEFDGFEDWPWPLIYKELDKAFPGSKFILTLRSDSTKWLDSLSRHAKRTGPTIFRKIAYGYADPWENEAHHIRFYNQHAANITAHFKNRSEQLLTVSWEQGSGWQELCRFLDCPMPSEPFPHRNRSPD